ncbi:MAG: histidine phosphatase family protein [Acidimicrobiia bacterium]
MRLWLVRHGVTVWSEEGRLCGSTDVPLSVKGREQAALVRPRLRGQVFDGIWTSDLSRAAEFARLTAGGATSDRRLRELDFGDLEGKAWQDCDRQTREALVRFDGFAAPGGESVADMEERVFGFLSGLDSGEHLIFTHGGVVRLLARRTGANISPVPGELTVLEWARVRAE